MLTDLCRINRIIDHPLGPSWNVIGMIVHVVALTTHRTAAPRVLRFQFTQPYHTSSNLNKAKVLQHFSKDTLWADLSFDPMWQVFRHEWLVVPLQQLDPWLIHISDRYFQTVCAATSLTGMLSTWTSSNSLEHSSSIQVESATVRLVLLLEGTVSLTSTPHCLDAFNSDSKSQLGYFQPEYNSMDGCPPEHRVR